VTEHSCEAALSERKFDDLVDAAYELDDQFVSETLLILFAGGRLGLRAGEIAHLDESWINWQRSIIEIPQYWPCEKGEDGGICGYCRKAAEQACEYDEDLSMEDALEARWNPKTTNSARAVPFDFTERIEAVITAFFKEFSEFESSRASINRRVDRVLEAAGYATDTCWPHALRATAATYLAYERLGVVPLQAMFGWASIETARKYVRLSGGATQKALHDTFDD
jgi:integrase